MAVPVRAGASGVTAGTRHARLDRLPLLARKALRDLWHLRGPSLALGAVVAAGVASFVAMRSMVPHLAQAQASYYRATRFADAWVTVRRAPRSVLPSLGAIPGVAAVEGRVSGAVVLEVPGLAEPASARVVGVPPRGMALSRLVLRQGQWLAPGRDDDVLVSEGFAEANRLRPGMTLGALLQGRWRRLRVTGVVLSPEHVLEMRPGELFPDARRFGVLWMAEAPAAAAFGLTGAWNEVAVALVPGAAVRPVLRALDVRLAVYGGTGAIGRDEHPSHRFLSDEIRQARTFAAVVPAIFLGVAGFLVHLVMGRLVGTQREQVGMLKAFGMGPLMLARHYALLALAPVLGGALLGSGVGVWMAGRTTASPMPLSGGMRGWWWWRWGGACWWRSAARWGACGACGGFPLPRPCAPSRRCATARGFSSDGGWSGGSRRWGA